MAARRHVTSLNEFAKAMFERGGGFADRVRDFEERFGRADANTLAVMAQASHVCWFHCHYRENLLEACRAIRTGRPTSLFIHGQVAPERWIEVNAYVVGVQRWLGLDLPLPGEIDDSKIERIGRWLGDRDRIKVTLAELFLVNLIERLWNTCRAKLGGEGMPEDAQYSDFTAWYVRPDGASYAVADEKAYRVKCERRVRDETGATSRELVGPLGLANPLCMHRSSRRLDIQLTSIGALKPRGNLPPDPDPKEEWQALTHEVTAGLQAWLVGESPNSEVAAELHAALGTPAERDKAIVRGFLNEPPPVA